MATPPLRLKPKDFFPFIWNIFLYKIVEFFQILFCKKITVNTSAGRVIGYKTKSPFDFDYNNFIGIPYAEPPIGSLRFKVNQSH